MPKWCFQNNQIELHAQRRLARCRGQDDALDPLDLRLDSAYKLQARHIRPLVSEIWACGQQTRFNPLKFLIKTSMHGPSLSIQNILVAQRFSQQLSSQPSQQQRGLVSSGFSFSSQKSQSRPLLQSDKVIRTSQRDQSTVVWRKERASTVQSVLWLLTYCLN